MGFEITAPLGTANHALPEGQASLAAPGNLTLPATDLNRVRITEDAVVLADAETCRIALRAPRDGEQGTVSVPVRGTTRKPLPSARAGGRQRSGSSRRVAVTAALRALGVPPGTTITGAMRFETNIHDDLLIVRVDREILTANLSPAPKH